MNGFKTNYQLINDWYTPCLNVLVRSFKVSAENRHSGHWTWSAWPTCWYGYHVVNESMNRVCTCRIWWLWWSRHSLKYLLCHPGPTIHFIMCGISSYSFCEKRKQVVKIPPCTNKIKYILKSTENDWTKCLFVFKLNEKQL